MAKARSGGVRALKRGLEVLETVNRSGGVRAGDIARKLSLARPTVYRLLETLEELGYVARSASDERFRVTLRAQRLGDHFDTDLLICQAAGPALAKLGRRLVWPIDFSIYDHGEMVVQETTHGRSPLALDHSVIGRRLPMLRTAAGRAYVAWCSGDERAAVLDEVRRLDHAEDRPFFEPAALDRMIRETRTRGYATRIAEPFIPKTSSIGLPIATAGGVLGSMTVIWVANALTLAEAVEQFLAPMREAATDIAERYLVEVAQQAG
jgi:IclR family mhp operon transcriptional activator